MSTDRKVPPPRRPATSGGAAARPAPGGGRPAPARPAPFTSRPAQRAAPSADEDDEKTAAFNIDDMPFGNDDDEKTAAFNIDDLPLDDEPPARAPQRTLVGHPVSGGSRKPPIRSSAARPPAPAPQQELADPDEATQAMNVDDMLAAIDADQEGDDDKTQALSLDEIQAINAAQQAARATRNPTPAADLIDESAKTVAVKAGAPIPSASPAPGRAPAGEVVKPGGGFLDSIEYFFAYPAIKARADRGEAPRSAVDGDAAKKGFINVSVISGGLLVLTLIAGLLK